MLLNCPKFSYIYFIELQHGVKYSYIIIILICSPIAVDKIGIDSFPNVRRNESGGGAREVSFI